jgi:hypothetical protein
MIEEHDIEIMTDAQNKLWELLSTYSEEDKLKVAGVCLKVTLQLYQTMLDENSVEKLLQYVIENLDDIRPPIHPTSRTIH